MTLERFDSLDALEQLSDDWDAFVGSTEARGFFLTWTWVHAWCLATREHYRPFVIVARNESGTLVGIAPLAINRASGTLEFLGQSYWGQFVEFAMAEGSEDAVMGELCRQIADQRGVSWSEARFRFVAMDSTFEHRLLAAFDRNDIALCEVEAEAAPYTELPSSIDDYYRNHSEHFAKRIRYLERRIAREGNVEFRVCDDVGDVDAAFRTLADMYEKRWSVPLEPAFATFLHALAKELVPQHRVLLVGLFVNGVPVGASYDWIHEGRILGNVWGWDSAWSRFEIGNVLIARTLRLAIERGYRVYDMLSGDAAYKRRWGTAIRTVVELRTVARMRAGIATPSQDDVTALGHLDVAQLVDARLVDWDPSEDSSADRNLRLILRGWALMNGQSPSSAYAAAIVGGRRFELAYGEARPDVAVALGVRTPVECGFRGVLRVGDIGGGPHVVLIIVGDRATGAEQCFASSVMDPAAST